MDWDYSRQQTRRRLISLVGALIIIVAVGVVGYVLGRNDEYNSWRVSKEGLTAQLQNLYDNTLLISSDPKLQPRDVGYFSMDVVFKAVDVDNANIKDKDGQEYEVTLTYQDFGKYKIDSPHFAKGVELTISSGIANKTSVYLKSNDAYHVVVPAELVSFGRKR